MHFILGVRDSCRILGVFKAGNISFICAVMFES